MPLRANHQRKFSRAGLPLRRFQDYEPGDTFYCAGKLFVKEEAGRASPASGISRTGRAFKPGRWLREF